MQRCAHSLSFRPATRTAFTLIELLVVVAIIALLVSILLPSLGRARQQAGVAVSLSNLRQVGIGLQMYNQTYRGGFPVHGTSKGPKLRWADFLWPFLSSPEVYMSPMLTGEERDNQMRKPFAHTVDPKTEAEIPEQTIYYGGYGYNYQYLGNGRTPGGVKPFHAGEADIRIPARTFAIADTHGSKDGGSHWTKEGVYVIDPPRMSIDLGSRGSRKGAAEPGPGQYSYRGGEDGRQSARHARPAQHGQGQHHLLRWPCR
jgi:prepilin-type N-terminal cleavage/methylation domain-containing protein